MPKFVISSGHSLYVSGAVKHLVEVPEARKVTDKVGELMRQAGVPVDIFHDNTSRDRDTNVVTIVKYHNSKIRDIDVSIHLNAGGGHGVEVLYYDAKELAAKVSLAISKASGLRNRGPKERKDLYFLRKTVKPAILIEVCFVDSLTDTEIYKAKFNEICEAIVEALTDIKVSSEPTPVPAPVAPTPPVTPPPAPTPAPTPTKTQRVVSLVDGLRFYNKPSWADKDVYGKMKKGEGFTIIEKIKVGTAWQYKVKNSKNAIFYVTASPTYVKVV